MWTNNYIAIKKWIEKVRQVTLFLSQHLEFNNKVK
ncbi:hypothetical protein N483_03095 [Pseudoalteromonas luteoviolacea NCIMB 1944]|nr:hypothetical protein N483_03095 [Pseudoalteromonas luteoviolacea NCIMB 1944]